MTAGAIAWAAFLLVPSSTAPALLTCQRDLLDFFLPMKVILARCGEAGHVPWWDPWSLGGHPFFANLQSQALYPPNWLFLVAETPWALSLFTSLHLALAGLGSWRLARSLGRSRAGAALAGTIALAGGLLPSLAELSNQLCTVAWFPWCCLAAVRHVRQPGGRRWAAWAAVTSMMILGAAPQVALVGHLTACIVAHAVRPRRSPTALVGVPRAQPASVRSAWLAGALAGLMALACCAVQLGPFAELVMLSDRTDAGWQPGDRGSLGARGLLSHVVRPQGPLHAPAGDYVRSLYLGPVVAGLAIAGALRRRRLARWTAGLLLAAAVTASAPRLPILADLQETLTPWLRYPIKYFTVSSISWPVLAALGFDRTVAGVRRWLRDRPASRAVRPGAWVVVIVVLADLTLAHRSLPLVLPADAVLEKTRAIALLEAQTRASGPRVHVLPIDADRLHRRARRMARGDLLGATRDRVERLEGGLPAVFSIHSIDGAAALTYRPSTELPERARRARAPADLHAVGIGFLLDDAARPAPLPLPVLLIDEDVRLQVVPDHGSYPALEWDGPNRVIGPPGTPAPSDYPGWREGPPGTWTFRPRGLVPLSVISLVGWLVLAGLAIRSRPRRHVLLGGRASNG